jgi:hypothetical protein
MGSLLFIAYKFGDLNIQEPDLWEVDRSGTSCLPPASVWVGLIKEAQLRHRLDLLGKTDPDPSGDNADHTPAVHAAITDPIHLSSPESDSEGDREVYKVGRGDQPPEKTAKEIQWQAEEEIARAAHLARDVERGKRHRRMSLRMVLLQGDTTKSSTHRTQLTENNSETNHDQSMSKSVG